MGLVGDHYPLKGYIGDIMGYTTNAMKYVSRSFQILKSPKAGLYFRVSAIGFV
jgi:hypothetical protein